LPAAAASSNIAEVVTQSYNAGPSVLPGMIVELNPKAPTSVIPLTNKDVSKMLGVVVPLNEAPINLAPQTGSTQQVLVATAGRYNLLVSNQNGSIKVGDYLTVSSLGGIGMKAGINQGEVVGQATGNFTGSNNILGTVSLKNSSGKPTTVSISDIQVNVHLGANPLFQKNASDLPGFLTQTANAVANGPVSQVRIYLSSVVLLATIIIAASMFYGGVRSGIVAVGRNPLAKKAIGRSLIQTVIGGLIIFVTGLLGVYLILKF
jgi:hypothetical protein